MLGVEDSIQPHHTILNGFLIFLYCLHVYWWACWYPPACRLGRFQHSTTCSSLLSQRDPELTLLPWLFALQVLPHSAHCCEAADDWGCRCGPAAL